VATLHQTIVWVKAWHAAGMAWPEPDHEDPYEGSARQRRRRRRAAVVAIVVAAAMVVPMVVATIDAVRR